MQLDSGNKQSNNGTHTQGIARLEFLENGVAVLHLGQKEERVVTLTVDRIESIKEIVGRLKHQKPPSLIVLVAFGVVRKRVFICLLLPRLYPA